MARVKVRGFTVVRDVFGAGAVEVEVDHPATVKGVLDALLQQYGAPLKKIICDPHTGEITPFPIRHIDELINSTLDGARSVKNGDEIAIIFPIGGGSQCL